MPTDIPKARNGLLFRQTIVHAGAILVAILAACGGAGEGEPAGDAYAVDSLDVQPFPWTGPAAVSEATPAHGCEAGPLTVDRAETSDDAPSLHVISIYEARSDHQAGYHPTGQVSVDLIEPGPAVLVLSAYEPTEWVVSVAPQASLERVILTGYHQQSAQVPEGVPVEQHAYTTGGSFLPETAHEWPSWRATALIDAAEAETGLSRSSFRGCYRSTYFQVGAAPSAADTNRAHECLAAVSGATNRWVAFDAEDGAIRSSGRLPAAPALELAGNASLGWHDGWIYLCERERGVTRVSLLDGEIEVAPIPCDAVTTLDDGSLLLMPQPGRSDKANLLRFETFAKAAAGEPSDQLSIDYWASRVAEHNGELAFAWHSTDVVEFAQSADGAEVTGLKLERTDGWLMGMDIASDGSLIVAGLREEGIGRYDRDTGELLASFHLDLVTGEEVAGITCR